VRSPHSVPGEGGDCFALSGVSPDHEVGRPALCAACASNSAAVLESEDIDSVIRDAEVIIYATGAETVLDRLKPGTPAIEYRHIPDPATSSASSSPDPQREAAESELEREAS